MHAILTGRVVKSRTNTCRKRKPGRRAILAVAATLAGAPVQAETCLLQGMPAESSAEDFLMEYLDVAFAPGFCMSLGATEANCGSYITRHRSDFFFGLEGVDGLAEDVVQSIAQQITLTNTEISKVTGIQGYAKPRESNDSVIAIVFIDPEEAKRDPKLYVASKLSWLDIGSEETLNSMLSAFIGESSSGCLTLNRDDLRGNLLVSSTLIKSNMSSDEVNQCVVRAFVGGMGLVADDLFLSEGMPSGHMAANGLYSVPSRYQSFLAVQYSPFVRPGMTRDQIEEDENIVAALNCGR